MEQKLVLEMRQKRSRESESPIATAQIWSLQAAQLVGRLGFPAPGWLAGRPCKRLGAFRSRPSSPPSNGSQLAPSDFGHRRCLPSLVCLAGELANLEGRLQILLPLELEKPVEKLTTRKLAKGATIEIEVLCSAPCKLIR